MIVTADFLRTLGVPPALGREFSSEKTRAAGPQAIILGDPVWRRIFGADPQVLGRAITLDGTSYTVVGDTKTTLKDPPRPTVFVPVTQTDELPVSNLAWIVRSSGSAGLAGELRRATKKDRSNGGLAA
jgi:hypothetical protein